MMDALAIEAAEEAVRVRLPHGGRRGPRDRAGRRRASRWQQEYDEVERLCAENGAFEQRLATDPADRALIWKGRKSAFAAVGRISPDYIVQDGVIPRTALPEVLRAIADLSGTSGVRVANVFHAGDGNLHPLCSSTSRRRARARPPSGSAARSSTSVSSTAAPSPASTAWGSTR
jgi:glycolate oxidase